jgi:peptidyl-prolyl cis-trans isomerase B (cyclophilin B)
MRSLCLSLLLLPVLAPADIVPSQLYNGINRPLKVQVRPPLRAESIELQLWDATGTKPIATKSVRPGSNDLAKLFPELWTSKPNGVKYVQLVADGKPTDAPLVLQPMTSPQISRLAADGKTVEFVPDEDQEFAGYRAYPDRNLVIETSMGKMEFRLRPDAAPNTTFNVRGFVEGGLYNDTIFHRVVAKRADGTPFVIQGGDPAGTGSGGPGWAYPLENSTLPHDFGVISIARSTDPNTNGCQIFVCLSRAGTKHLDSRYAAFGQLIKGAEVVLKIGAVPVGKADRPNDPPKIHRMKLVPASPFGSGPKPLARPEEPSPAGK